MVESSELEHYGVLGLPHFTALKDVKKAYRQLALVHHPDKQGLAVAAGAKASDDEFIRIADSYHFLMRNKTLYDVILS